MSSNSKGSKNPEGESDDVYRAYAAYDEAVSNALRVGIPDPETQKRALWDFHKGLWVNCERVVSQDVEHPCLKAGFCPYGGLVEVYPLPGMKMPGGSVHQQTNRSCGLFGHDCPAHYMAENVTERTTVTRRPRRTRSKQETKGG